MHKVIKTRTFLREFKDCKEQLLSGKLHSLVIDVGNGEQLEISRKKPKRGAEEFLRKIKARGKPLYIERTDIFDSLLRSYD